MTKNQIFGKIIVAVLLVSTLAARAQNVGILTSTPNTALDVNGAVSFEEGTALSLSNGVNNNVTIGNFAYFRVTGPTAAFSITGFTGGQNGRIVTIVNATSQTMTLSHQTTSSSANQLTLSGGLPVNIRANGTATFQYNSNLSKWVMVVSTAADNNSWSLTGNSGTSASSNFLGTTDAQDLVFRTSNTEQMRITSNGRVGIASFPPNFPFQMMYGMTIFGNGGFVADPPVYPDSTNKVYFIGDNANNSDPMYFYATYLAGDVSQLRLAVGNDGAASSDAMVVGALEYTTNIWNDWMGLQGPKLMINGTTPLSNIDVNGSTGRAITTTTSNITLDNTHATVILTGGTPIVTLPTASTCSRRTYTIVNNTGGSRSISSYVNFGGGSLTTIGNATSITVQSNGSSWFRIR